MGSRICTIIKNNCGNLRPEKHECTAVALGHRKHRHHVGFSHTLWKIVLCTESAVNFEPAPVELR